MKIKHVRLLLLMMTLFAAGTLLAQSEKVSINLEKATLNELLNAIEAQSSYKFLVNEQNIDLQQTVTAQYTNTTISDILEKVFDTKR